MVTNVDNSLTVQPLRSEDADEAMAYLEARPVATVCMRSFISDNGIVSSHNRGAFYACRAHDGRMKGVALIGDAILFEADDEATIDEFARFARAPISTRLIRGERKAVERFWQVYAERKTLPNTRAEEHLLVMRAPIEKCESVEGLRPATLEDLPLLLEINASLVCAEGGRNPLENDPAGFSRRLAARIVRGRVWVWRAGDRLMFKTDLLSDTPQAIYIEGVYVAPEMRGRGVGLRCLTQMGRALLERSAAICLTVREDNNSARSLYRKAAFEFFSEHTTVYLQPAQQSAAA